MTITQTRYFAEDAEHYTNLAKDYMYTNRKEEIRQSIFRLEKMRGRQYVKKLAGKCNQKLKMKFYVVED